MSDKKYWQSFAELKKTKEYEKKVQDEFQEDLPFADLDDKGILDAATPRRDFLKYLGFSTAAATLASCQVPTIKAVPYGNKPGDIVPGVAKYFATTYVQDGDAVPIVAKVRDGRPIKIEGNDLCAYTRGGTSARVQASVLDLYDTFRLTHPKRKVQDKFEEIPTFEQVDQLVAEAMGGGSAGRTILLTSTINSPSTKEIISRFPNITHIQYDADSYSGMLLANESGFGRKAIPSYNLQNAKVIVGIGADFLGTWLAPVEFALGYSLSRKFDERNPGMSKHFQFESHLSMTGANADERFTHRPSETLAVVQALQSGLSGGATQNSSSHWQAGINKVLAAINANRGAAVVMCGSNDVEVQNIVNAINRSIGAYNSIIDWGVTLNYRAGIDKDIVDLLSQMESGAIGTLMIYGANPVYEFFDGDRFAKAMTKVPATISFSPKLDETSEHCKFLIPSHHFLESWGDAEPRSGFVSFMQPTIFPLFKTRPWQTSLLKWSNPSRTTSANDSLRNAQTPQNAGTQGADLSLYENFFRQFWTSRLGGEEAFNKALQDGFVDRSASSITNALTAAATAIITGGTAGQPSGLDSLRAGADSIPSVSHVDTATTQPHTDEPVPAPQRSGNIELVIYQKVSIGNGKQSGNPWLQELPDPITKAAWDNYAMMSMTMAKELLGLDLTDRGNEKEINNYQYFPEKPVISIAVQGRENIELPVLIIPGMDPNTIAVSVGYGRSAGLGKAAENIGFNAYRLTSFNGQTISWHIPNVSVTNANRMYRIAQSQVHNYYEGRHEVVRETSMATFKKSPEQFKEFREELAETFAPKTGDYRSEATIYPMHSQPGIKWGMTIDLNSCTGCGACVVACHAENNVPVVGKREVARYHDMHWLRIDRYFVSNDNNPDQLKAVVFQPMLCQHCDNAPCENVCPVAATNHSAEGINQMAYNRCIGTRYCANNCPYKVRRFNWADYTGADSFPDNQDMQLVGKLDDVVFQMNEDLTRMVLNPDVTVRSRGVMEKCSFCVQRTQEAKLNAKKENRPLRDGDVKTACMQACPTHAIVFGNVYDGNSAVAKNRAQNDLRTFYVLEQIHTLPNITYFAKIRNTDEIIESKLHHGTDSHAEAGDHSDSVETVQPVTH